MMKWIFPFRRITIFQKIATFLKFLNKKEKTTTEMELYKRKEFKILLNAHNWWICTASKIICPNLNKSNNLQI